MTNARLILLWMLNPSKPYLGTDLSDEDGATAVEYGLMVALIAIVIITAVGTVGTNLVTVFTDIALTTALN